MRAMLLPILVLLSVVSLGAGRVDAGAWPREVGTGFVSSSVELGYAPAIPGTDDRALVGWSALYAEWGLTPRVTVAFDFGRPLGIRGGVTALGVLRYHLTPGREVQVSGSVAGGMVGGKPAVRVGFALGRGIESRWGHGWTQVELAAIRWTAGGAMAFKTDLTVGVQPDENLRIFVQAQGSAWRGGDMTWRLGPGMTLDVGPFEVEGGVVLPLGGGSPRLKLGTWLSF